jgi:hypothetical protein
VALDMTCLHAAGLRLAVTLAELDPRIVTVLAVENGSDGETRAAESVVWRAEQAAWRLEDEQ